MPTYDYECTKCGHKFEAFQNITAPSLDKCPKCGKKVKRLISSGAGLIFKGSGFYSTDYRKKPKSEGPAKNPACPAAKEGCNACQHH
ncbi:MAG: FmdB family zinc ribbon protein [Deltaproteobacteria bacterium]